MNYCLPPDKAGAFNAALKDGTIDPDKMREMTSEERRGLFAGIVGEENARDVNALLESKLLLKDQKAGMVTWAKQVSGMTEPAKRDLLSRIQKMDKLLNPAEERAFLADATAQKLGATVTLQEAARVSQLAKVASDAKATMQSEGWNPANGTAYGRAVADMHDYVNSLKPQGQTFTNRLIDILNIPKSALTSIFHLSAPFVQGWGMLGTKQWYQGFGEMLKYFAKEENYRDLNGYIIGHPDYPLALDGKLGITNLGDKLSMREEALQSTLIQKASAAIAEKTGLPDLVRASSRAFTGFLNFVRFNRFTQLLDAARNAGEDVRVGQPVVRDLAKVVNDFTGRGAIGVGDKYASAAPALNAIFFSPRKISATIQMFEPLHYIGMSAVARNAAIRQLVGAMTATGAVLGLGAAMGAKVQTDPRAQGFAKMQIGNEKLDMTGGNAIFLRLLGRLFTNQEITSGGKQKTLGYNYAPTRADLVAQYMRGKLSPTASFIADALYGSDPVGRPFSLSQEAQDKLMPITIQSFINFAENDPKNYAAVLPALSAIFGVGLESPIKRDLGLGSGPAESELSRLNFNDYDLPRPSGDPDFDKLVLSKLKPLVNSTLASFVQSPGYQKMGDPQRALMLSEVLKGLERAARGQAIAADPQAYQKILAAKVNPRLQAVMQPQGATP